jgi:hypothetical protein
MSIVKLNLGEPAAVSPRAFFQDICPVVLSHQAQACAAAGGSIGFLVVDAHGGAQDWLLDLPKARVQEGGAAGADLYLQMSDTDMVALLQGKLNAGEAAAEGRVIAAGSLHLLGALAALLSGLSAA